jgi:hypothetical protein
MDLDDDAYDDDSYSYWKILTLFDTALVSSVVSIWSILIVVLSNSELLMITRQCHHPQIVKTNQVTQLTNLCFDVPLKLESIQYLYT